MYRYSCHGESNELLYSRKLVLWPHFSRKLLENGTKYSAPLGERSSAISLSVCVSVCLSVNISLEPLDRPSQIFGADPLWSWLGPPLAALR